MAFGNATKGYVRAHSGGGGGGGTSNYNQLSNKPQINGVELSGNKSSSDLGISGVNFTDVTSQIASGIDISNINGVLIIGEWFDSSNNKHWSFSAMYPTALLTADNILSVGDDRSTVYIDVTVNNNIVTLSKNSGSTADRNIYKVYTY